MATGSNTNESIFEETAQHTDEAAQKIDGAGLQTDAAARQVDKTAYQMVGTGQQAGKTAYQQYEEADQAARRRRRRRRIAILLLLLLLLSVGSFICYRYIKYSDSDGDGIPDGGTDWIWPTMPISDEQTDEPNATVYKIPSYSFKAFAGVSIKTGSTDAAMALANPESNNVYMQFIVKMRDTGEVLYQSDLVEPGKGIYKQTLSRTFEPGEYACTLQINAFALDTQQPKNGVDMNFTLVVNEG